LGAGTYNGTIAITAAGASNSPQTIPLSLTVTNNPTISNRGIVSAADYRPLLTRGSVASIFGSALANATAAAATVPLPRTLGGVRVTVNGTDAPLWYVSSGQINFQVPFEAPLQGAASVIVYRDGVASAATNVSLVPYAPAVFLYQRAAGVFDPIITRANNAQLIRPDSPAEPGDWLTAYATGIGNLASVPATGVPSPAQPLPAAAFWPAVTIGGVKAEVGWAGLTPGSIGLAQFNIRVPAQLPSGQSLPLVIDFNGAVSSPVGLAVKAPLPDLAATSFTAATTCNAGWEKP
jgi:uncharacterized protein (TIGR03437 family)